MISTCSTKFYRRMYSSNPQFKQYFSETCCFQTKPSYREKHSIRPLRTKPSPIRNYTHHLQRFPCSRLLVNCCVRAKCRIITASFASFRGRLLSVCVFRVTSHLRTCGSCFSTPCNDIHSDGIIFRKGWRNDPEFKSQTHRPHSTAIG